MTKFCKTSFAALLLAGASLTSASIAEARPMTAEDLATMNRVGSPAISPDEQWLVFSVTETDPESYERSSSIWLRSLTLPEVGPVKILNKDDASEHSPTFSADGKFLYYLSDASGSEQLWRQEIDGSKLSVTYNRASMAAAGTPPPPSNIEGLEPEQASDLKANIAGFKLSPTGNKVAVWGNIAKDCPTFGCDEDGNRAEPGPGTGREYDELFVRHWSSWETPGNYSRIFAFDLTDGKISGDGEAVDRGVTGDSPSKPFGGGEEIDWAPDGKGVMFALRKADRNEPKSTNLDIYTTPLGGNVPAQNLTFANKATDTMPAWSPDGKYYAWAAMDRPGYESDQLDVMVRDVESGTTRNLTADWDRSVGSIAWTPDSRKIILTAQDVLDHPAYEVDLKSGKVARLTAAGNANSVIPMKDGSIIYTMNSRHAPTDIYRRNPDGKVTQLTNLNGRVLQEIDEVSNERFSFKGANGNEVWGMITKPKNTTDKLPMAFLVHGGPQGSFGDSWSFRWNPKVMASQGYAVVSIDFHGSAGYGQEFMDSINQDWGGKPLTDLKLGFEAALKEDSQIDGERTCALGASYGGYMMNWIAGNWPDRFDCIVNHAGIFDLRSFAFSTEELWFDQWDHGGPWWKRADPEKWNPINRIENWKTPMLVIHGEKDFRIPYTQSLMPFTYLQEKEIPSKLLIFPDENHWILKGKNSVQWHRTVFEWINKWTAVGGQEGED